MNFVKEMGEAAVVGSIAEEAGEVSLAAMKLERILRGESPTPVEFRAAVEHLIEELGDLCVSLDAWLEDKTELELKMLETRYEKQKIYKRNRWEKRIRERKEKSEDGKAWEYEWKR